MDQSMIIHVADAVVAELTGAGFAAARSYRPQFGLDELASERVTVVPKGVAITSLGRNSNQHDVAIDVALQKKVSASDTASFDALMIKVQQLADALRLRRLASMPSAAWVKTENAPVYAPEHLESKSVFTSVLTFTFRVVQ